ncbi:MAG: substrate-binding domain-containing protein [Planctomycetia bacterium]|nr:substrate-binding domain-containing protein [Planctomycetia bacterium]
MHRSPSLRLLGLVGLVALVVAGCGKSGTSPGEPARLKMGLMPKLMGISYFNASEKGAREAAGELGIDLDFDGPAVDSAEEQVKMIDRWIAQGYDMIAVAANDPELVAPALRRAKEAGITILTWDADANPEASGRETFVNQAPIDEIGQTLVDILGEALGGEGKAVIVTGSATSPNQNAWMKAMRARIAEKYPKLKLLETLVSDEDQSKAYRLSQDVINAHGDLVGIWAITSVSLPGAAKAVRDAGKAETIFVTGLSLPNTMREYVEDGTIKQFVLWSPVDLGYLTVHVAKLLHDKKLAPGEHAIGRLKSIRVRPGEVLLGPPKVFDRENVGGYDF